MITQRIIAVILASCSFCYAQQGDKKDKLNERIGRIDSGERDLYF